MTEFVIMPIPTDRYGEVCALLGGVALLAVSSANVGSGSGNGNQAAQSSGPANGDASLDTVKSSGTGETLGQDGPAPAGTGETATTGASPSDGEVDAHGHPWSAELHASTKGKTKDGLWRMKVGVTRPAPLPGFPVDGGASTPDTGTSSTADAGNSSATSQGAAAPDSGQPATSTPEAGEDDEFAAFRAAAAASDATDSAAAASVPARQFSDADLSALCNQAAVKLGDPAPIKEIISKYVPEGQVAHSRNIPAEQRDNFAKEVEAKAGITFAG